MPRTSNLPLDPLAFRVKVKTERSIERKLVLEQVEIKTITEDDVDEESYMSDEVGRTIYFATNKETTVSVDPETFDSIDVESVLIFKLSESIPDAEVI